MTNRSNWDATAKENARKGFRIHLLAFVLVTPAIWVIWYFSGKTYPLAIMVDARLGYRAAFSLPWRLQKTHKLNPGETTQKAGSIIEPAYQVC